VKVGALLLALGTLHYAKKRGLPPRKYSVASRTLQCYGSCGKEIDRSAYVLNCDLTIQIILGNE